MRRPPDDYGVTDQPGLGTLLVGLGGVCERTLRPHVEAGRAATLGELVADGAAASLPSQVVARPASAWPTLYTGVNPGRHGVFGRLAFDGHDWAHATFGDVREHALWELLDRRGRSSVVVNVPMTAPPRAFDGALVSGWGGPDRPACHPTGLLDAVDDAPDGYRVYVPDDATGGDRVAWRRRLAASRSSLFAALVERLDPDFGFLGFHQTATVFREQQTDAGAQAAVFDAVDDAVAAAVEATDPDTVVVASDHGLARFDGQSFRVNDFLRDRDLLSTTRGGDGETFPLRPAAGRRREPDDSGLPERLASLAASAGATSQRVASALERVGLGDAAAGVLPRSVVRAASERVDPAASVAYARSGARYGVRINRAGREPDGVVSPAAYPSVRSDLVDALRSVRTPDGRRVFSAVGPAEQFFGGPHVDAGPDVVTVPRGFDVHLDAALRGERFGDPPTVYAHVPRGLVVLAGDGVDESIGLDDPHVFDVAPTVLASLGVAPSTRMDGSALAPVDGPEPTEYAPFTDGPGGEADANRRLSSPGRPDGEEP